MAASADCAFIFMILKGLGYALALRCRELIQLVLIIPVYVASFMQWMGRQLCGRWVVGKFDISA